MEEKRGAVKLERAPDIWSLLIAPRDAQEKLTLTPRSSLRSLITSKRKGSLLDSIQTKKEKMISSFQGFVWHWEDVNVKIKRESVCVSVCGGYRKGVRKFVVQRGSEEEKREDYQKMTSHSRVACQKIKSAHDATARTNQVEIKWPKWPTHMSRENSAAVLTHVQKKVASQGPSPPSRPSYWQGWQRSHDAPLSLTVKPTSNGQGAVPVKAEKERHLKNYRDAERDKKRRREREKQLLHTLLSTLLCQNRLIHCVHKP